MVDARGGDAGGAPGISADSVTLRRLRGFLGVLAAALFVGTAGELLLVGHTEDLLQLIPFALCALGVLALAAAWRSPGRASTITLRAVMALTVAGCVVGVAQHANGNLEIVRETRPNATTGQVLSATLGGGNPLFAPGILAVAAALSVAATYSAPARPSNGVPH